MTGLGSGIPPVEDARFPLSQSNVLLRFEGAELRTVVVDGEIWFVAADVLRILDVDHTSLRSLDDDEKGRDTIPTLGGPQAVATINEPGLYSLIIRSRKPEAREFKRWVTHDVIPSIRRTGAYVATETPEQQVARALIAAQGIIERKDAQIAVLTPRAEAWDDIASADGDYSVADAAKMLARREIETGPQRLFEQLADLGWIFRGPQGKWRPYASAVDAGYLAERPQSHHHPRTGEVVLDPPQVRVTLRGLERLRIRLGVLSAVEVAL